jgi:hypothetical protein
VCAAARCRPRALTAHVAVRGDEDLAVADEEERAAFRRRRDGDRDRPAIVLASTVPDVNRTVASTTIGSGSGFWSWFVCM